MTVTFFGHGNAPEKIMPKVESALKRQIEAGANCFYVGNHGNFDMMVKKVLKKLKRQYPHIQYAVVLAYLPAGTADADDYLDTIYPDGLETTPPKFAIANRNRWMLKQADTVVAYVISTTAARQNGKRLPKSKEKS